MYVLLLYFIRIPGFREVKFAATTSHGNYGFSSRGGMCIVGSWSLLLTIGPPPS
uniref:Uncharacterized protein n=1 Tax=Heterorhabditis bacteriophora TaxID=37862 RepID=A0A1I7WEH7_HETBA